MISHVPPYLLTACDCNMTGSVNASSCTIFGGVCDCQPGVTGRQCDTCQSGWFNFSVGGCEGMHKTYIMQVYNNTALNCMLLKVSLIPSTVFNKIWGGTWERG